MPPKATQMLIQKYQIDTEHCITPLSLRQKSNQFLNNMRVIHSLLWLLVAVLSNACVKKQLYQTELIAHKEADAKVSVLTQELSVCNNAHGGLVQQIAELSKTIGHYEGDIAQLRAELVAKSNATSEMVAQLTSDKSRLTTELATTKSLLDDSKGKFNYLRSKQQERSAALSSLRNEVIDVYKYIPNAAITLENDLLLVTLPDDLLFESNGLVISKTGRATLDPLAKYLSTRPSLDVEILAYTDNQLPKNAKNLADTWDWSLFRATTIVRLLISDMGVNANQLTPVGKGEFYPVASNESAEGRQQNRRTQIVFRPVLTEMPVME
jgi:chemotaxis protein MotB